MIQQLLEIRKQQTLKTYQSTKEWSIDYYLLTKDKTPIDKAIIGGFTCHQFSFAFMSGYQAALEQMFPFVAPNELKALCVSEEKGGHPKSIQTILKDNIVTGLKTYVTAGTEAEHLLVLCKTEEMINDRPVLKMVYMPRQVSGVEVTNFELPFMKNVKHGRLALTETKIEADQVLKGDGYNDYTKPFRTLEDICVSASYQAMLLRQAVDNNWDDNLRDQLLLNIYTLKNLLKLPPSDQETHLLLAAVEHKFETLLPTIEEHILNHTSADFKTDWEGNKKVISMSKKIKELRLSKARASIFFDEQI